MIALPLPCRPSESSTLNYSSLRAAVRRCTVVRWNFHAAGGGEKHFDNPDSPYHRLFKECGGTFEDAARLVESEGLEGALKALFRNGIYLIVEGFKGRKPASRGSAQIDMHADRLRNPQAAFHVAASGGGSRSNGIQVLFVLEFIRGCAARSDYTSYRRLPHGSVWVENSIHPVRPGLGPGLVPGVPGLPTRPSPGQHGRIQPDPGLKSHFRRPISRITELEGTAEKPGPLPAGGDAFLLHLHFWIFITWFPTYLAETRGIELQHLGVLAGLPLFVRAATNSAGGWVSDRLVERSGLYVGRSYVAATCFILCAVLIVPASLADHSAWMIVLFVPALAALESIVGISWAAAVDLGGEHAGLFSGFMNTCGNLAGVLSPLVFGVLVEYTGMWNLPFLPAAALCLPAAGMWLKISFSHAETRSK